MAMISSSSSSSASSSSASLAPGFRFHPTDEELVRYYLRRKVCGKPFRFDAISDIDIYKLEPWDLPGKSILKTRDLEWYFFSVLDKKYGNSSRTNRATERGYWKTTGKDRVVYHRSQVVGMKKTLVYHSGRAPRGERTNWVMHEYKLIDEELEKAGIVQDAFVLCRVFQKSGSGPKNGEQYGAPFVEEEWDDDELEMIPKMEHAEEVEVGADAYLDGHDLEQILGTDVPPVEASLPFGIHCGGDGTLVEVSTDSTNNGQTLSVGVGENHFLPEEHGGENIHEIPVQHETETSLVKHEFLQEASKTSEEVDYLLDEPLFDSMENVQFGDGAYLETNDLLDPVSADTFGFDDMLEEYLSFHDANLTFDPSKMVESEDLPSDQAVPVEKDVNLGTQGDAASSEQLTEPSNVISSSNPEMAKFASECQYPFLEQASRMLGNIPAPPAFASEFPKKDAALHLNYMSPSSSSLHVTAGVIQIQNLPVGGCGTDWSLAKHGGYNIILSFGLSHGDNSPNMESTISILPGKFVAALSRGWFYFLFLWVLVLSMSFKIATIVCAR